MRDATEEVPVLVVGAGPAGLAAAITLARHGVECLLVERREELSSLPRATAISLRSMELLRGWGMERSVRDGGTEVEWQQWFCHTLAQAADGHPGATGYPTRAQSAMLSPTTPACVPQDHLEPVLLEHLRALPAARVELGAEVRDLALYDDGGARVTIGTLADGTTRTVEARYVIAADGAHSAVRRALDVAMEGPDDLARAVSAVFRAPLSAVVGDHRYGLYATGHPEADGVFLPAGRGDRWLYATMWGRDEATPQGLDDAGLARRIRLGAGVPGLRPRIERTGAFRFAAQLAERFRVGDVLLVGDAAHRATPRGGTGMNSALHDGHDVGWKLAWVLQGWAGPALLNSYEAERRPVAAHNVGRSADPAGTARGADQELHADLGGRIAHVWVEHQGALVSTIDLLGDGLTLFTDRDDGRWRRAIAGLVPVPQVIARPLDPIAARAVGIGEGGALLVRPDGATARWFAPGAEAGQELRAAIAATVQRADGWPTRPARPDARRPATARGPAAGARR
jgi:2-polyprenyl-6-methoxyphenol hydroxylase-like FAD-dependent oxidoreductase